MKVKLYVDNHKIKDGVPFVIETDDEKIGTLYAAKVTFSGPVTTEFLPEAERPNCFVITREARSVQMNEKFEAIVMC
jgi:hypothetical protein